MERLQKIMARAGIGSRRHNEEMISAGRVFVNGKVAKLGDSADSDRDTITIDNVPIKIKKHIYIMLNKPKGVLSSTEDELNEGRQTVRDLVDVEGHLYPVGRLDMQSEGLILLTNDGEMAHHLTHPRYGHEKTYRVSVERQPSQETLQKWRTGIMLDEKMTAPCEVQLIKKGGYVVQLRIIMREGRKRQIRRVASLLGHPVRKLKREKIGPLHVGTLEVGKWRELSKREVGDLMRAVRRSKKRVANPARPEPPLQRRRKRRRKF